MHKKIAILLLAPLSLAGCGLHPLSDGALGKAKFGWDSCDCAISDRAMAAGGAATSLTIETQSPGQVAKVVAQDPGILTITSADTPSSATRAIVHVFSGSPGTTTVTAFDAAGSEIDHALVTVAPTAEIGVDQGWQGDVLEVVAGQSYAVHAITWGSRHEDLTGVGAIQFAFGGVLQQASMPSTFADQESFRAGAAGDGQVLMTAIAARRTLDVHAIDPATIDSVRPQDATVSVKASATAFTHYAVSSQGITVYGAVCAWEVADRTIASVRDAYVSLGMAPSATVEVKGLAHGTSKATCSVNGRTAAAFDIQVE